MFAPSNRIHDFDETNQERWKKTKELIELNQVVSDVWATANVDLDSRRSFRRLIVQMAPVNVMCSVCVAAA